MTWRKDDKRAWVWREGGLIARVFQKTRLWHVHILDKDWVLVAGGKSNDQHWDEDKMKLRAVEMLRKTNLARRR